MSWPDLLGLLGRGSLFALSSAWLEFRRQLFQSFLLLILSSVCGAMALLMVAAITLLVLWDAYRYQALVGLMAFFTGLGVMLYRASRSVPRHSRANGCCADGRRGACGRD